MLDEEAQSEEDCEDCVHLSCKEEEDGVPYSGVDCCPEFILWLWEQEEVHLFLKMDENDAGNGNASEDVGDIDSAVRLA